MVNEIRKNDADKDYLARVSYPQHLWMEREIKSAANVCRNDAAEFLKVAAEILIMPDVQEFALADATQALLELKQRNIRGAKVLRV